MTQNGLRRQNILKLIRSASAPQQIADEKHPFRLQKLSFNCWIRQYLTQLLFDSKRTLRYLLTFSNLQYLAQASFHFKIMTSYNLPFPPPPGLWPGPWCRSRCNFFARSRLYIGPNLLRPPRIRSGRTAEKHKILSNQYLWR